MLSNRKIKIFLLWIIIRIFWIKIQLFSISIQLVWIKIQQFWIKIIRIKIQARVPMLLPIGQSLTIMTKELEVRRLWKKKVDVIKAVRQNIPYQLIANFAF